MKKRLSVNKSYIYIIFAAMALMYGSLLCTYHREYLNAPSTDTALLFLTGLAILSVTFFVINLLIKSAHPETTACERLIFSSWIILLIYMGTHLIDLNLRLNNTSNLSYKNPSFFFGVYLLIFGVFFLHFLLKK